jgi:hypothetical protein
MKTRAILLAGLASVSLAACQRSGEDASAPEAVVSSADASTAVIESCPPGSAQAVCADQKLAALHGQVKQGLTQAASSLSAGGAKLLADNQKAWLDAQRTVCGVDPAAKSLAPDQETCLQSALTARAKDAGAAVQKVGSYVFQRAGSYAAYKVAPGAAGLNAMPGGPDAVMADVAYPQLEGDSPEVQKFNAAAKRTPRFKAADATEETVRYKIAYAGPDLISVKYDTYDNTVGAAHPNTGIDALNFNMKTGLPLSAADLFSKPGWEALLAKRGAEGATKQLKAMDETASSVAAADLKAAVINPKKWAVTDKGLVLLLGEAELGAHALGLQEVTVPWSELKPYLKADAIGPAKG